MEKQKAEYAEKMKNKVALIHKQADEKRAAVKAIRGEELLKVETTAKHRATGSVPKKLLVASKSVLCLALAFSFINDLCVYFVSKNLILENHKKCSFMFSQFV